MAIGNHCHIDSETTLRKPSIVTVTCLSIGLLVGLAVALSLYLGLSSAASNTQRLLVEQVENYMDLVEERIDSRLQPAVHQAEWVSDRIEQGYVSVDDLDRLDSFMTGVIAATPQMAGVAYVSAEGIARRWDRRHGEAILEDWSKRAQIFNWLQLGADGGAPAWREPFWTDTIGAYVLLHDARLERDGEYLGMFGQVIPINDLSAELDELTAGTVLEPFILYKRSQVLAHRQLLGDDSMSQNGSPLLTLDTLDDPVLRNIWSPDNRPMRFLTRLKRTDALQIRVGDRDYGLLYRQIDRYGDEPWFIGVHFDFDSEDNTVIDRLVKSSFAGLGVLLLSVLVAIALGRKLSQPIVSIAGVAQTIAEEELSTVRRLPGSRVREIDSANLAINNMVAGLREREVIRDTLGRYLPEPVARAVLSGGGDLQAESREASVLFCDIEGFTTLSLNIGPGRIVEILNAYFSRAVEIIERNQGVVTQFQGDGILAVFNVPVPNERHAESALQTATELLKSVDHELFAGEQLSIRIGINTGAVVAGAVGAEGRLSYTVHGDAVNKASRIESLNKETGTRLLLAESTTEKIARANFISMGCHELRGDRQNLEVFTVAAGKR